MGTSKYRFTVSFYPVCTLCILVTARVTSLNISANLVTMVTKTSLKYLVIKQCCHQWKLAMAAEITYASLKISRQVRECVSKVRLNVYLKPRMLKPMVQLISQESRSKGR
jgi:hypothetical protein